MMPKHALVPPESFEFVSKPEAYTHAISFLRKLNQNREVKEHKKISLCIENLKIAFENHEQNPAVVCAYLKEISSLTLPSPEKAELNKIIDGIQKSEYKQTAEEKFENRLGRQFESQLLVQLLLEPTKAMMRSVSLVSHEILNGIKIYETLQDTDKEYKAVLQSFLKSLVLGSDPVACGSYESLPTLEAVKKVLVKNDPSGLIEIMFIHLQFASRVMRKLPITTTPDRKPVGKFALLVEEKGGFQKFLQSIGGNDEDSKSVRKWLPDIIFYGSPLYKERGRKGKLNMIYTSQLGLMLPKQRTDLPSHESLWCPDCRCQNPDLKGSQCVRDYIENDTVYVAGPSGLLSLYLGLMELYANFSTVALKQNYLTACCSYIVGAGFHSLHEILGPAEYCLNLVPGYLISVPEQGVLASPPNFHLYFEQQSAIDPEFKACREVVWKDYLDFYDDFYKEYQADDAQEMSDQRQEIIGKMLYDLSYAIANLDAWMQELEEHKGSPITLEILQDAKQSAKSILLSNNESLEESLQDPSISVMLIEKWQQIVRLKNYFKHSVIEPEIKRGIYLPFLKNIMMADLSTVIANVDTWIELTEKNKDFNSLDVGSLKRLKSAVTQIPLEDALAIPNNWQLFLIWQIGSDWAAAYPEYNKYAIIPPETKSTGSLPPSETKEETQVSGQSPSKGGLFSTEGTQTPDVSNSETQPDSNIQSGKSNTKG